MYSEENIEGAMTSPQAPPTDLLGIRESLMESSGYSSARADVGRIQGLQRDFNTSLSSGLTDLKNEGVSMARITGRQAQLKDSMALEGQTLNDQLGLASGVMRTSAENFNAQYAIASRDFQEKKQLMYQMPGAGIKLGDTPDIVAGKIQKHTKVLAKEAKKESERDSLVNMFTQLYGYYPKKTSRSYLKKKVKKRGKSNYKEAQRMAELDYQHRLKTIANIGKSSGGSGSNTKLVFDPKGNLLNVDPATGEVSYASISGKEGGGDDTPQEGEVRNSNGVTETFINGAWQENEDSGWFSRIGGLASSLWNKTSSARVENPGKVDWNIKR